MHSPLDTHETEPSLDERTRLAFAGRLASVPGCQAPAVSVTSKPLVPLALSM